MSGGIGVVSAGEITIVRRDDGVLRALRDILTSPLTDAWTTGISKNQTTEFAKNL